MLSGDLATPLSGRYVDFEVFPFSFEVYAGAVKDREVDFVAISGDRKIYIQSAYLLADEQTVEREYAPLELIPDNYEKFVVSLDDVQFPSRDGIKHIQTWNLKL